MSTGADAIAIVHEREIGTVAEHRAPLRRTAASRVGPFIESGTGSRGAELVGEFAQGVLMLRKVVRVFSASSNAALEKVDSLCFSVEIQ